jgi:rRNA pseudouridine-1189 N-methylase Emg1 (Nep1/Mra1 family)
MKTTKTKLVEIIKEELSAAMNERRMTPEGLLATIKDKLEYLNQEVLIVGAGENELNEAAEAIGELVEMIDTLLFT